MVTADVRHGILSTDQLSQLSSRGYLALDPKGLPELLSAYVDLFDRSKSYFSLGAEEDPKRRYRAARGPGASEEGYSLIPAEKQIFTCRSFDRTPDAMRDEVRRAWELTGEYLSNIMTLIAHDLGLESAEDGSHPYSPLLGPCLKFETRTPTLLRLFRYDRPSRETAETELASKIVAEPHKDLGLLTLVVGSSPGLEVYDESTDRWHSIEEQGGDSNPYSMTVLAGQTLRFLSRGQYRSGVHRVRVASASHPEGDAHRFSIVYALRPFSQPVLQLSQFESPRVGHFSPPEAHEIDTFPAGRLFRRLCDAHWNVNIDKDLREAQKATHGQAVQTQVVRLATANTSSGQTPERTGRWQKRWTTIRDRMKLPRHEVK